MKVLYDYQAFAMQRYGGVSRCFAELASHLPSDVEYDISIKESDNAYIQNRIGIRPTKDKFNRFLFKGNFKGKWRLHHLYDKITKGHYYPNYNQYISINALKKGDFDVFHPTYFDDYFLPYLNGKPFVLTIHDMIPEKYPQYFARDDFQIIKKQKLTKLASAIIAVSENTKKDIIDILKIPGDNIHVIYHGCSFPKVEKPKRLISEPYILYVGARNDYKDFELFVHHSLTFLRNNQDIKLVCTGPAFSNEEIIFFTNHDILKRVIHCWTQTDDELYSLYHHAICFVYPSEYEGFGIPILEAYTAGCPVLLNNASCFPEIAGDAATYFKVCAEDSDLSEKLEYISHLNNKEKETLIHNQQKRLQLFSWEKSASQLCNIYQSIL